MAKFLQIIQKHFSLHANKIQHTGIAMQPVIACTASWRKATKGNTFM